MIISHFRNFYKTILVVVKNNFIAVGQHTLQGFIPGYIPPAHILRRNIVPAFSDTIFDPPQTFLHTAQPYIEKGDIIPLFTGLENRFFHTLDRKSTRLNSSHWS